MTDKLYIFTLDGCGFCTSLKNRLSEVSIPFTEIEVNANPHIWNQVVTQTENDALPTIYIQKEGGNTGPVYVPGKDYDSEDEIIEILQNYFKGD
jgi:glutaredoxin